jgi:hypothetical protein
MDRSVSVSMMAAVSRLFGDIVRYLMFRWQHRGQVQLYDNIWRRRDGVCVDDNGREWDEYWQKVKIERRAAH